MTGVVLPGAPGSYRWYYVDAACGEHTVVAIFMIGSLFSSRYAASPAASPRQHSAVNFAVYRRGRRRAWVLSEYGDVEASERSLSIGRSSFTYLPGRRLEVRVAERTAPWGTPLDAQLTLEAVGPGLDPLELVPGLSHRWHPIAPRARARVTVPSLGLTFEGAAYHDGNFGEVPLGTDLRGWDWSRKSDARATVVTYRPWGGDELSVSVTDTGVEMRRAPAGEAPRARTAWGLDVPARDGRLVESSPFYARLETDRGGAHELGEVADFERFRSPWIRWMARLRTRMERAA